jgi:hypothetical protein
LFICSFISCMHSSVCLLRAQRRAFIACGRVRSFVSSGKRER